MDSTLERQFFDIDLMSGGMYYLCIWSYIQGFLFTYNQGQPIQGQPHLCSCPWPIVVEYIHTTCIPLVQEWVFLCLLLKMVLDHYFFLLILGDTKLADRFWWLVISGKLKDNQYIKTDKIKFKKFKNTVLLGLFEGIYYKLFLTLMRALFECKVYSRENIFQGNILHIFFYFNPVHSLLCSDLLSLR